MRNQKKTLESHENRFLINVFVKLGDISSRGKKRLLATIFTLMCFIVGVDCLIPSHRNIWGCRTRARARARARQNGKWPLDKWMV